MICELLKYRWSDEGPTYELSVTDFAGIKLESEGFCMICIPTADFFVARVLLALVSTSVSDLGVNDTFLFVMLQKDVLDTPEATSGESGSFSHWIIVVKCSLSRRNFQNSLMVVIVGE
jgi:hypothetical protein